MPPDPTPKTARKRPAQSKRGPIACVRCKERKAKCVPAPPGTSSVPTCENCHQARAACVYLDRTPNEIFLLEYVSQLETRIATLELELARFQPDSKYVVDHSHTQAAAIESLSLQYPSVQGEAGPSRAAESEGDDLEYGLSVLTLSGSGEPVYIGASSGVNWARVCTTALRGPRASGDLSRFNYLAPPETSSIESALSYSQHHPIPPLPPPHLAARYLEAAYQHIQARYSFLDWPTVRNWHEHREEIVNRPMWGAGRGQDFRRSTAAFTLWLLYGYGARLTEDENLEGAVNHEVYHNIAVACLSNVTNHTSISTVQAELLLTIYSFRHPQPEISVWQIAGLALRMAIQIGLHRKARTKAERDKNPLEYEIKKRTFWTLYTIDRMLALQLGRPSGIQDRDIDVEMPLNIDADFTDAKVISDMQTKQSKDYAGGYETVTSMTSAIHNTRLNRLKQRIQDALYRLDQPKFPNHDLLEVNDLLIRLHEWKVASPVLPPGRTGVPLLSPIQQSMEYHNCVQMLLRPVISRHGTDQYLRKCFDSAAALCEDQWSLLNSPATYRLSNWALYRLFLSGLTLLHLATSPSTSTRLDLDRARKAMQRCRDSLSVYIRHLPAMKGYEDVYVELVAGWDAKRAGGGHTDSLIVQSQYRADQPKSSLSPQDRISPLGQWAASVPVCQLGSASSSWADVSGDPQQEQVSVPGASVRDDFFSLLASLGVDMDESLGSALPPIAEDHLWTSDWGMHSAQVGEGDGGVGSIDQSLSDQLDWTASWGDQRATDDGAWTFPFI